MGRSLFCLPLLAQSSLEVTQGLRVTAFSVKMLSCWCHREPSSRCQCLYRCWSLCYHLNWANAACVLAGCWALSWTVVGMARWGVESPHLQRAVTCAYLSVSKHLLSPGYVWSIPPYFFILLPINSHKNPIRWLLLCFYCYDTFFPHETFWIES